ncbi:MAG: hypothetical protein F7C07_04205, partial [Desulfurococcales archaeon]|nr:hypothetical protein [Desulfurococcales archaeon]
MVSQALMTSTWRELVNWYIVRSRDWCRLLTLTDIGHIKRNKNLLDIAYGLWGYVWHELDLVMRFSHILLKYMEEENLRAHLHVNYRLKPDNFKMIADFYDNLNIAVKALRSRLHRGRNWLPEIDLIIVKDYPSFLYCLEFKYYHYIPTKWNIVGDLR